MHDTKRGDFFLACSLGQEQTLIKEIQLKFPSIFDPDCFFPASGGVLAQNRPLSFVLLNQWLKVPNRILFRLATFKARDFPKLYQKACKIQWNRFIGKASVNIKVSSHHSRLFDERKVTAAISDAISEFRRHQPLSKEQIKLTEGQYHNIYLRFENDECTISLDTSGEPLYMRGNRPLQGIAPLRETHAAAMLTELLAQDLLPSKATLFDPMCGSGTILLEAEQYFLPSPRKKFRYLFGPFFQEVLCDQKISQLEKPYFFEWELIGWDRDPKAIDRALSNKKVAQSKIDFKKKDFFKTPRPPKWQDLITICNLPYGKRLKVNDYQSFLKKFISRCGQEFQSSTLAILCPVSFPKKMVFKNVISMPISNQNLKIKFIMATK